MAISVFSWDKSDTSELTQPSLANSSYNSGFSERTERDLISESKSASDAINLELNQPLALVEYAIRFLSILLRVILKFSTELCVLRYSLLEVEGKLSYPGCINLFRLKYRQQLESPSLVGSWI